VSAEAAEAVDPEKNQREEASVGWPLDETPSIERLLSKDEIASLLGFGGSEDGGDAPTGMDAIISATLASYERLPMLETALDRLARLMTTSLRNFTSANVEVSLDEIASIRFGDYLNATPPSAIIAVFRAVQWDNFGLVVVDASLVYSVVDALLAGLRGAQARRVEGRPYTTIERTLVTRMVEVVLADARQAFAPLTDVEFKLDRIESNSSFAAIAPPPSAAIVAKIRIDIGDRGGRLELILPHATLDPIRSMLRQQSIGEGGDDIWEGRLADELRAAKLEVRAVLDESIQPLRTVLHLKVGDTLMLDASPDAPVKLRCGQVDLSTGRLGRMGGWLAVRLERAIAPGAQQAVVKLGGESDTARRR
jgi:flagellar motor switch protein FliM